MLPWIVLRNKDFVKVLALICCTILLCPYLSFAFNLSNYQPLTLKPHLIYKGKPLSIPSDWGTVEAINKGKMKTVIVLQDLHCDQAVQRHIAAIIKELNQKHHLTLIGQEGAAGPIKVDHLRRFPFKVYLDHVTSYFLDQGKLTGAEYAALNNHQALSIVGLENQFLYAASLKKIHAFLNAGTQGTLMDLRQALSDFKPSVYNQRLMAFDNLCQSFHKGDLEWLSFAEKVRHWAKRLGLHTLDLAIVEKRRSADPDVLIQAMDRLIALIEKRLDSSAQARELQHYLARVDLMEKLLNISATPEELALFLKHRNEFRMERFIRYLRQKHPKLSPVNQLASVEYMLPDLYQLDQDLDQAQLFYQLAEARSLALARNMVQAMDRQDQSLAVMITGGFHTPKILAYLKAQHIGYLAVKPRVENHGRLNPYFSLLQGKALPLERLLKKDERFFALPSWLQSPWSNRVMALLLGALARHQGERLNNSQKQVLQTWLQQEGETWTEEFSPVPLPPGVRLHRVALKNRKQPLLLLTAVGGTFSQKAKALVMTHGKAVFSRLPTVDVVAFQKLDRDFLKNLAAALNPALQPVHLFGHRGPWFWISTLVAAYAGAHLAWASLLTLTSPQAMLAMAMAVMILSLTRPWRSQAALVPVTAEGQPSTKGATRTQAATTMLREQDAYTSGAQAVKESSPAMLQAEQAQYQFRSAMISQLSSFYGDKTGTLVDELIAAVKTFRSQLTPAQWAKLQHLRRFSQADLLTMVYGNSFVDPHGNLLPLQVLLKMAKRLKLKMIHLAPFYPSDVDNGYSPIDLKKVSPDLGTWKDIKQLSRYADLMFDFSALHGSSDGPWVQKALIEHFLNHDDPRYQTYAPYKSFVKIYDDLPPVEDTDSFIRPRLGRPFTPYFVAEAHVPLPDGSSQIILQAIYGKPYGLTYQALQLKDGQWQLVPDVPSEQERLQTARLQIKVPAQQVRILGQAYAYTTFTRPDRSDGTIDTRQTDWNYDNPQVFLELSKVLLFYITQGATMIRFDAVGYIVKRMKTQAMHLPETHQLLQALEMVLNYAAPYVETVGEVNEKMEAIETYLEREQRPEVSKVYNFAAYTLGLEAIWAKSVKVYTEFQKQAKGFVNRQIVNLAGCHDGIPFKATYGLLAQKVREQFSQALAGRYGAKPKAAQAPGGGTYTYEVCSTTQDALNPKEPNHPGQYQDGLTMQIARQLVLYAMNMGFRGLPADYYVSRLGGANYLGQLEAGEERDINRERFNYLEVLKSIAYPRTLRGRVIEMLVKLLPILEHLAAPISPGLTAQLRSFHRQLDKRRDRMGLINQAKEKLFAVRARENAFDPNGPPVVVLDAHNDAVLCRFYESPDGMDFIVDLLNVSDQPQQVRVPLNQVSRMGQTFHDLLSRKRIDLKNNQLIITLKPYQVMWLKTTATALPDEAHQARLYQYSQAYKRKAFVYQPPAGDKEGPGVVGLPDLVWQEAGAIPMLILWNQRLMQTRFGQWWQGRQGADYFPTAWRVESWPLWGIGLFGAAQYLTNGSLLPMSLGVLLYWTAFAFFHWVMPSSLTPEQKAQAYANAKRATRLALVNIGMAGMIFSLAGTSSLTLTLWAGLLAIGPWLNWKQGRRSDAARSSLDLSGLNGLRRAMKAYLTQFYEDASWVSGRFGDQHIEIKSRFDQSVKLVLERRPIQDADVWYDVRTEDGRSVARFSAFYAEDNRTLILSNIGKMDADLYSRLRVPEVLFDFSRQTAPHINIPHVLFPQSLAGLFFTYASATRLRGDQNRIIDLLEETIPPHGLPTGQSFSDEALVKHELTVFENILSQAWDKLRVQQPRFASQAKARRTGVKLAWLLWQKNHDLRQAAVAYAAGVLLTWSRNSGTLESYRKAYAQALTNGDADKAVIREVQTEILEPLFQKYKAILGWDLQRLAEALLMDPDQPEAQDNPYSQAIRQTSLAPTRPRGASYLWFKVHHWVRAHLLRLSNDHYHWTDFEQRAHWIETTYVWLAILAGLALTTWISSGDLMLLWDSLTTIGGSWAKALSATGWLGLYASAHLDRHTPQANLKVAARITAMVTVAHLLPLLMVIPLAYIIHGLVNYQGESRRLNQARAKAEQLTSFSPWALRFGPNMDMPASLVKPQKQASAWSLAGLLIKAILARRRLSVTTPPLKATVHLSDGDQLTLLAALANQDELLWRNLLKVKQVRLMALPASVGPWTYGLGLRQGQWLVRQGQIVTLYLPYHLARQLNAYQEQRPDRSVLTWLERLTAYAAYRYFLIRFPAGKEHRQWPRRPVFIRGLGQAA